MVGNVTLGTGSIVLALVTAGSASAAVVWNEQVNGDLSDDRFNPTPITLGLGVNSIMASTAFPDEEYFTISLPANWQLNMIIVASYVGKNSTAFIAVQEGSIFTEPPDAPHVENLLGWTHFGPGSIPLGTDILDEMGNGVGAIGFTPPLHEGNYTFWMQQTETEMTTYQMDFIVRADLPACLGDIVVNQVVDVDDLLAVIIAWGPCPAPPATCPANINNTGTSANRVDVDDLLIVISSWGPCP